MFKYSADESGVTVIEYIMLAALIIVVYIGVIAAIGNNSKDKFDIVNRALANANEVAANSEAEIFNCLAAGTNITMADMSTKKIEEIAIGDEILTFNHETGYIESREVNVIYTRDTPSMPYILHFANGNTLTMVGEHDLFEEESSCYVTLTYQSAEDFIGNHYYDAVNRCFAELSTIEYPSEPVAFYCLYSQHNYNVIANNMLTLVDDVDEYLNIFEFDENLVIDSAALAADIERYGIYEFDENGPFTKAEYDEYNGKYLNIMIVVSFSSFFTRVASQSLLYLRIYRLCFCIGMNMVL